MDNDERGSPDHMASLERSLIERALHGDVSVVYECDIPSFARAITADGRPLLQAIASRCAQTVDLLRVMTLRGADASRPSENERDYGSTPLHAVAKSLYLPSSAILLRAAPEAMRSPAGKDRVTPLHLAASVGATAMFSQAREALGARVFTSLLDIRDAHGCTPLLVAAKSHHPITVSWIIRHGGGDAAAECDSQGNNALHIAAEIGDPMMMLGMISDLFEISRTTASLSTSSSSPSSSGSDETLLLDRYMSSKNDKGMRAVDIAYQKMSHTNQWLRNLSLVLNWARLRQMQSLTTSGLTISSSSFSSSSSSVPSTLSMKTLSSPSFSVDPELGSGSSANSAPLLSFGISPRASPRISSSSLTYYQTIYSPLLNFLKAIYFILSSANPRDILVFLPLSLFITICDNGTAYIWPVSLMWVTWAKSAVLVPNLLSSSSDSKEAFLSSTRFISFLSSSLTVASFSALIAYIATRLLSRLDVLGGDFDPDSDVRRVDFVRILLGEESSSSSTVSSAVICVTCSIARPSRSKHCTRCGRCVATFDHCCSWTGCCISSSNHGVYLLFVLFASLAAFVWLALLLLFVFLAKDVAPVGAFSRILFLLISFQPVWMLAFGLVLLVSHVRMISRGITTNEVKKWRGASYAYLRDEKGRFRNPYDRKSAVKNCAVFWTRAITRIFTLFTSVCDRRIFMGRNGKGGKQG